MTAEVSAPPYHGEAQMLAVRAAVQRLAASRDGVWAAGAGSHRPHPTVTMIEVGATHLVVSGERCRAAGVMIRLPRGAESAPDMTWLVDGLCAAGWRVEAGEGEWAVLGPGSDEYVQSKIEKRESEAAQKVALLEQTAARNARLEELAPLVGGRLVRMTPDHEYHIVFDFEAATELAARLEVR